VNVDDPNVAMTETVAHALGSLKEDLVFVGGCAVGLLITDDARPPIRATRDVDLVAEVATRVDYYALAERLRKVGFQEHIGDVNCRWRYKDLLVDVMPTDESILGFSNGWYVHAVRQATRFDLPTGTQIRLVSPPLLVATKIEAFYGRGNDDYGGSHDIEDIINLVDGRPELPEEIERSEPELRDYLRAEIDDLLSNRSFVDTIPWHFGPDRTNQARAPVVIERLRKIAGL